jgi:UDP-glucose 4-epimerase
VPYYPTYLIVSLAFATIFQKNIKLPGLLIPSRFESRMKPLRYTNRLARDVLGWQPPLDHRECLARTFGSLPAPRADTGALERTWAGT